MQAYPNLEDSKLHKAILYRYIIGGGSTAGFHHSKIPVVRSLDINTSKGGFMFSSIVNNKSC